MRRLAPASDIRAEPGDLQQCEWHDAYGPADQRQGGEPHRGVCQVGRYAASTVTLSDGVSTFTADTLNSAANNDLHGRFYYLLVLHRVGHGHLHGHVERLQAVPEAAAVSNTRYGGTVSFDASIGALRHQGVCDTAALPPREVMRSCSGPTANTAPTTRPTSGSTGWSPIASSDPVSLRCGARASAARSPRGPRPPAIARHGLEM